EAVSAAADAYVDAWWSAAGGLLFGACGGLTLHSWKNIPQCPRRNNAHAAAICALATAALLTIDALLALSSAHRDEGSVRFKSKRCSP
ncbi:jg17914, partial [Pararge aegeria aegeria]